MTQRNQLTAVFDGWFSDNYIRLKESLSLSGAFNEDAFHDAYISARKQFKGQTDDLRQMFVKEYTRISRKHISDDYALLNPDELFFALLPDRDTQTETEPQGQPDKGRLVYSIKQYIRLTYPPVLVTVWECRVIQGLSLADCKELSGLPYQKVKSGINSINLGVRQRFAHVI